MLTGTWVVARVGPHSITGLGRRGGSPTWGGRMEKVGMWVRDSTRVTRSVLGTRKGDRSPVGPEVLGDVCRPPPHPPDLALEGMWGQQGGRHHPVPSIAVPPACASAALVVAARVVLLKVALSDALLTSILLAQS